MILKYAFAPYLVYFIVANFYYFECMLIDSGRPSVSVLQNFCEEDGCDISAEMELYVRVIFFVFLVHQVFIEIFQIKKDGFRFYIQQRSNNLDIISLLGNLNVLILFSLDVDIYIVRIFGSIAIVTTWSQMFLWFRLFDSLA